LSISLIFFLMWTGYQIRMAGFVSNAEMAHQAVGAGGVAPEVVDVVADAGDNQGV
jgi:hypothetical protein